MLAKLALALSLGLAVPEPWCAPPREPIAESIQQRIVEPACLAPRHGNAGEFLCFVPGVSTTHLKDVAKVYIGNFATGTASAGNTIAVTGVGFRPTAIQFFVNGRTESSNAAGRANAFTGHGCATKNGERWAVGGFSQDNVGTSAADRGQREDCCLFVLTTTTTINGRLDWQSMDSDGFTLVVDDAFTTSYRVMFIAYGGSINTAKAGSFNEPGATGSQSITGVGFRPDIVFFGGASATTNPSVGASNVILLGAATASASAVLGYYDADAQGTTATGSYCRAGECIAYPTGTSGAGTAYSRASLSSMGSDGFTLNWAERDAGRALFYLAMKGGSWVVGDFLTSSTINTTRTESGLGTGIVRGILFASCTYAANSADASNQHAVWSVGVATSASSRMCMGSFSEDDADSTNTGTAVRFDAVVVELDFSAGTVTGLMDVSSMGTNTFSAIVDDAFVTNSGFVWYAAVGDG